MIYCYHYTCFRLSLFSDINVSQGSVATLVRCGGIFNAIFISNFLTSQPVKELWKSADIWRCYRKSKKGVFFETQCSFFSVCKTCVASFLSPLALLSSPMPSELHVCMYFPRWQLQFVKSEFPGQLPKPYSRSLNATREFPSDMNDANLEEPSRYVSITFNWFAVFKCHYYNSVFLFRFLHITEAETSRLSDC